MHTIDRHVPAVAGDVPKELVDRPRLAPGVVEPDRVVDPVADDDLSIGIVRARHPYAQPDGPAVVLLFLLYSKRSAARLGDVEDVDVEPGRASLRGIVLKRQIADDAVPLARESNREVLEDIECAVGLNG
jgi:hypothetical protein